MTVETKQAVTSHRIPPQNGFGLILPQGDVLRIVDPFGEQVADVVAFGAADTREWMSSGRTIDYAGPICLTTGHVLYSNRSKAMFTIVNDTVGRHDFMLTPCSPERFRKLYDVNGHHPSCFENLVEHLRPLGIEPDQIPTTFNAFMNVEMLASGEVRVCPPTSRPGDAIELRAEMDLVVGITACSAELSNSGSFKPIDIEIVHALGS